MTTIYISRTVESEEQAEALPEGTLVVRPDIPWIATKRGPDENGHTWWESKNGIYDHCEVVRELALVPIEVDAVESVQLGQRHHLDLIDRHPFTVYIDYQETP